jgi:D-alanyl-D-alanine carboxypeptidase (penicillin-binding protein 5/6)
MVYRKPRHRKKLFFGLFLCLLIAGYVAWALLRPLPLLQPVTTSLPPTHLPAHLSWPVLGQSAVGIVGTPVLDTNTPQTQIPTASTAKVITALLVLEAKPLKVGEQGPMITINANDVALYNNYRANDGSFVPVQLGEQISEYQALQTIMLPSANNMADTLAIWAYGSLPDYQSAATAFLAKHHIANTTIGTDASGLDPSTKSTATGLVRIGELAMQNSVLAQIVGQSTADNIPVAGTIRNVNWLLGSHNVIGIKTGNSDEAGGAYLSASTATVNGKPVTIVTALMAAPDLLTSMNDSLPFIDTAQTNFQSTTAVKAKTVVGAYKIPWNHTTVSAVSEASPTASNWGGSSLLPSVKLDPIPTNTTTSKIIGQVTIPATGILPKQSASVKLSQPIAEPSLSWRLTHPY